MRRQRIQEGGLPETSSDGEMQVSTVKEIWGTPNHMGDTEVPQSLSTLELAVMDSAKSGSLGNETFIC